MLLGEFDFRKCLRKLSAQGKNSRFGLFKCLCAWFGYDEFKEM
jgi:hypothetical protein